jgi:hypothetical protein
MFQRKLIAVLGALILLALTAGIGNASVARVQSMDLASPLQSQFTDDYVNIYTFPTSVVRQNNLVLAELGENTDGDVNPANFSDRSMTLIKSFPKFGAIAFDMRQSAQASVTDPVAGSPTLVSNNQLLDIIWGKAFSKMDLALRFDLSSSSFEHSDNAGANFKYEGLSFIVSTPFPAFLGDVDPGVIVDNGIEMNTWGVTPAIALHMSNDNRVEGAVTFREYTLNRKDNTAGGESWQDAGNLSYAVNVRAILNHGDKETWYPAFWYVNNDLGYDISNLGGVAGVTRTVDETYKTWGIGISNNMKVNDNNLLLFGVALASSEHNYSRADNNAGGVATAIKTQEQKVKALPSFFAALETQATSWLTLRMGANKDWVTAENDDSDFQAAPVTNSDTAKFGSFNFRLGTGIKWNNLDIDMTLDNQFPLTGGWLFSGNEASPFTHVSATYHF